MSVATYRNKTYPFSASTVRPAGLVDFAVSGRAGWKRSLPASALLWDTDAPPHEPHTYRDHVDLLSALRSASRRIRRISERRYTSFRDFLLDEFRRRECLRLRFVFVGRSFALGYDDPARAPGRF